MKKKLKQTTTITLLLSLCVVLLGTGCEKDETSIDPNLLIQGKWEIEAIGNGDDLEPYPASQYIEYYQDSLVRIFDYETDTFLIAFLKYEINDSLFHRITYYPSIDETWNIRYYYTFLENNKKLKLDNKDLIAIFNTLLYKRID